MLMRTMLEGAVSLGPSFPDRPSQIFHGSSTTLVLHPCPLGSDSKTNLMDTTRNRIRQLPLQGDFV